MKKKLTMVSSLWLAIHNLCILVTNMGWKIVIIVMGIFVDDLFVTGNSVEEIAAVQE